jgi:RNA polymerase sigma-70 factor (ECF subfamily)
MPDLSTEAQPLNLASGPSQFRTTHWSVILEAASPSSPNGRDAFARLYSDYWYPLYAYVRRRGRSAHEAEDLTQDFFVALLERERLRGIERGGGRFRSFLLKALQNFLANEWDRAQAKKRGGGKPMASLDEIEAESRYVADPLSEDPEASFERHWAFTVIGHAMKNLEAELQAAGKDRLLEMLRPHLQGDRNGKPYAAIATEMGVTESAVKMTVHRLRQRYGELLRTEVARTVGDDAEIDVEVRHLIAVVSNYGS